MVTLSPISSGRKIWLLLGTILSACFDKWLPLAIRSLWIWFDLEQSSHEYFSCSFVWNRELHIVLSSSQFIGTGILFELSSSTELTLLLVLSGALSEGLSFKCACKSSSFYRTWSISFGIGVVDRPTVGAHPSMTSYGDRFIPTWSRLFFWNCTNCKPVVQLVVLLSLIQLTSISWISPLDLSTLPWDWGSFRLPHRCSFHIILSLAFS